MKSFLAPVDSSFETNNSTFSLKLSLSAGQPFFSLYKNSGLLYHKLNISPLHLLAKIPLDRKSAGFNFPGQCLKYKASATERILVTLLLIETSQFLLTHLIQYKASRESLQQYLFFYKNKPYKNDEAEIGQKIRTNLEHFEAGECRDKKIEMMN